MKSKMTPLLIFSGIVILVALIPGILLFIFEFPESVYGVIEAWKVEGTLGYFGSVLSLIGSLFMGMVVFYQTEKHQEDNEHWRKLNTARPFLEIENVFYLNKGEKHSLLYERNRFSFRDDKFPTIYVELKNIGEGVAINLTSPGMTWCEASSYDHTENHYVAPNNLLELCLASEFSPGENRTIWHNVYYQNLLGQTYSQKLLINYVWNVHCFENEEEQHDCELYVFPISAQKEHKNVSYCFNKGQYYDNEKHKFVR